jgi:hypothetical protein
MMERWEVEELFGMAALQTSILATTATAWCRFAVI